MILIESTTSSVTTANATFNQVIMKILATIVIAVVVMATKANMVMRHPRNAKVIIIIDCPQNYTIKTFDSTKMNAAQRNAAFTVIIGPASAS